MELPAATPRVHPIATPSVTEVLPGLKRVPTVPIEDEDARFDERHVGVIPCHEVVFVGANRLAVADALWFDIS